MRLTDLVSGANLDLFATVSMGIFLLVFTGVVVRVLTMSKRNTHDAANLPLDDGTTPRHPVKERRHG
ncbi:MAG: hypothetical protein DHS20C14_03740 [Phycisphaeraceae bacterium]|nr:MAG: hypothetical protein DHS20C14_03740 [Phycisphaeraceae bacterium]